MPCSIAACSTDLPFSTASCRPSIVRFTVSITLGSYQGSPVLDVLGRFWQADPAPRPYVQAPCPGPDKLPDSYFSTSTSAPPSLLTSTLRIAPFSGITSSVLTSVTLTMTSSD